MPNLSQIKRERMMNFLNRMKGEHSEDEEMFIVISEVESELNAKKIWSCVGRTNADDMK